MVGVPTSKGCALCRRRSVKCDEARPSCFECRRGGRKCPGYPTRLKFVSYEPMRVNAVKQHTSEPHRLERSGFPAQQLDEDDRPLPNLSDKLVAREDATVRRRTLLQQISLQSLERLQLVSYFLSDLFPIVGSRVQLSFLGSWLWFVPEYLDRNDAMDLASHSLALAYFAKSSKQESALINSYHSYGMALNRLSIALQNPKTRLSSETLCAALLLVHYEKFVAVRDVSSSKHAAGVGYLIRSRGAHQHASGFEAAMLLACRGLLVLEAMSSEEACFLSEDDWMSIPIEEPMSPLMPKCFSLYHEIMNHFAFTTLLWQRSKLVIAGATESTRLTLLYEAQTLRADLMRWHHKFRADSDDGTLVSYELPSQSADTLFPLVYMYSDVVCGTLEPTYFCFLIQVNKMIDSLGQGEDHSLENYCLAVNICMAAEYCSKAGYCGMQTMKFALPAAAASLPADYHYEIEKWREKFRKLEEGFQILPDFVGNP